MVPTIGGVFWLAMVMIVYYDCQLNSRNGLIWAAIVFFTGPIGFIAYFLLNRDTLATVAGRQKRKSLKEKLESKEPPRSARPDLSYLSLPPTSLVPEHSFTDPELDALIRDGKIIEAREHLHRVLKLAEDMGDTEFAKKYDGYADKIEQMERPR